MAGIAPTNSYCVTSWTMLTRWMPLRPSRSPRWTKSTRVDAGPAVRLRRLAQADGGRSRFGLLEDRALGMVGARPGQVVDVAARDARQALEADLAEALELAPQHLRRGRSRHLSVGLVDLGQQPDVAGQVAPGECPAAVGDAPIAHLAGVPVLADQPLDLRRRRARQLGQEAPQHALVGLAETPVCKAPQRVLHEGVGARPVQRLVVHRHAAVDEGAHLLKIAMRPVLRSTIIPP